ncbi:hypothetical protein OAC41_06640 [Acidimicrobiales bacterium]|nr:hypothetical protein [Acidimicrobiales bacterium]
MEQRIADFLGQNQGQKLIFSHEVLSFARTDAEAQALKAILGDRDLSIAVVLRDPGSFLTSWRKQLRESGFADHSRYRSSFMYTEDDSWLVDYEGLVAAYASAFRASNVVTLIYEAELAANKSVVPGLMALCGVSRENLPGGWEVRRNVTEPALAQRIKTKIFRLIRVLRTKDTSSRRR